MFRNSILSLTFIGLAAMIFTGCPDEVNPPEPRPSKVRIKAHNGDTLAVDRGTRPIEGALQLLRLEWSPITDSDNLITEYIVYRSGGLDSAFAEIAVRTVNEAETDSFIEDAVIAEKTYYYYVVAKDSKGNTTDISDYLDEENLYTYVMPFRLAQKASPGHPHNQDTVVTTKPQFSWCIFGDEPGYYVIKVATSSGQLVWLAYQQPGTFGENCGAQESMTLNKQTYSYIDEFFDGIPGDSLYATDSPTRVVYANSNFFEGARLQKGVYQWRVDSYFGKNNASRSPWVSFTVNRDYKNP